MLPGSPNRSIALERWQPTDQFIGHDSHGIHIAAGIRSCFGDKFWRQVGNRSHHRSGSGAGGLVNRVGKSKISHFYLSGRSQQNVLRFNIPMNNLHFMGGLQRL